ncbi:Cytochrome p450 [Thalictrum thalictroides]|uniref:Cytochrome p450 n=1 Tax=Thalictrum thalictroides TaxID=46969 RepID=A0A7J6WNC8_THATH|nr:Cytochrome p450 [Thalictrum thalictroides]
MEYLKLVVHESTRLRHVAAINILESSKATNIKGFHVPAKTVVIINHWSIQRNSKSWERPNEFLPERFVNNPVDSGGQNFNFTPFGSGRRVCPGKSFALIIVESTIANLPYWFDWKTVGGEKFDMSETFTSSVRLKTLLHLVVVPHFS